MAVASYPTMAAWHQAKALLGKFDVESLMGEGEDGNAGIQLKVAHNSLDTARQVLGLARSAAAPVWSLPEERPATSDGAIRVSPATFLDLCGRSEKPVVAAHVGDGMCWYVVNYGGLVFRTESPTALSIPAAEVIPALMAPPSTGPVRVLPIFEPAPSNARWFVPTLWGVLVIGGVVMLLILSS